MKINKFFIINFIVKTSIIALIVTGLMNKNILMRTAIITAVIIGPLFCGWMCFFGIFQDFCRFIGQFFFKKPLEISRKFHNVLKYLRYVILIGALTFGGMFLFPGNVRYSMLMLLNKKMIFDSAFVVMAVIGILSLFTKRFFCRYFCVIGARYGLFSMLRLFTINRNDSCVNCGKCTSSCSMNIQVEKINSLASPNCINCLNCINSCPQKSLTFGLRNYKKSI